MEATIKLHDKDFTLEFFNQLKAFVKGKEILISIKEGVEEDDETINDYLLKEPAFAAELYKRIEDLENGKGELVQMKLEDLL
jgi:hypothetical protein